MDDQLLIIYRSFNWGRRRGLPLRLGTTCRR